MRFRALLLSLCSALVSLLAYAGSNASLTPDERRWLDENQARIVLAVETGYPPFVFLDADGQSAGLAHDYLRLVETKIGASFRQQQLPGLKDIFEKVRSGEVHIVNAVTKTAEREKFLSFTAPFIRVPNVILVRSDRPGDLREENLSGLTVSLVSNYAITEDLTGKPLGLLPDLVPDLVPDDQTALLNVSFGRSDAAVVDLATASYLISQKGITNLRIAGEAALSIRLALATPLDQPVLHGILQKGLDAISAEEREIIKQRWIHVSGPNLLADRRFWLTGGGLLLLIFVVIAVIALWNRTLRRQVRERTAELEKERVLLEQRVQERTAELEHHRYHLEELLAERTRDLQASETRYRTIADFTHDWEIWIDPHGTFLYCSPAVRRMTGYEPEAFLHDPALLRDIVHPDDRAALAQHLDELHTPRQGMCRLDFRIVKPDGTTVWVEHVCVPVFDVDGSYLGRRASNRDITDRVNTLAELETAKLAAEAANRAKSAFLANMSHELRTPLNGIMGMTDIALRHATDPKQIDQLTKAKTASTHLLHVINDILDISKIEAERLKLEHADFVLGQVLENIVSLLGHKAAEKGLKLQIDLEDGLPTVRFNGDPMRLAQILLNLAGNAVKFTEQGAVTLRCRHVADHPDGTELRWEVADTGIGIESAAQARLFTAFEQADGSMTRKYGGTGLGLAISKRLAHMMGGEIGVDSTPGQGSTFWFTVRLGKAVSNVAPPAPTFTQDTAEARLRALFSGTCVLLAEDEPINQEVSRGLLEDVGLVVDLAADGQEALALAHQARYALILMDMQMPHLNGADATRAIRDLTGYADTPILAMTANAFDEDRQRCLDAGMNDHIAKPVDPGVLYETLLKWLTTRA